MRKSALWFSDGWRHHAPGDDADTLTVLYRFTSIAGRRVTVQAHASCACLAVATVREDDDPGQAGILTVTMTIGVNTAP
jgi:hypothetical protein